MGVKINKNGCSVPSTLQMSTSIITETKNIAKKITVAAKAFDENINTSKIKQCGYQTNTKHTKNINE